MFYVIFFLVRAKLGLVSAEDDLNTDILLLSQSSGDAA